MSRFTMFALLMVALLSAWGCGGKEAAPPPGAESQPTKAPTIEMPGEPATPPADKK